MKKLSEIVARVPLKDLVEVLSSTVEDGEVQPEPKPACEGEREFVKIHKTEKFEDPTGNKSDVRNASNIKKDTSKAGKEPLPHFPKDVKEDLDEAKGGSPTGRRSKTRIARAKAGPNFPTVMVYPKGYKGAGKVKRIPKSQYDAKKYSLAEQEQIDELSKSTMTRYVDKATGKLRSHGYKAGWSGATATKGWKTPKQKKEYERSSAEENKELNKASNRVVGIQRAARKLAEETQLDETSKEKAAVYYVKADAAKKKLSRGMWQSKYPGLWPKDAGKYGEYSDKRDRRTKGMAQARKIVTKEETQLDEVITKKTPAGDVIHDFVHSDNKKFSGDSKKQRIKRALGAYYGMHKGK